MKFKDGVPIVDNKGLSSEIKRLKQSGVWNRVLTAEDRTRLKGIDSYARRVFKSLTDTGTSLEQAQAIAALKAPSTFLQGLHALFVNNRVMAPLIMSKKTTKLFTPKARSRGPSRKDAWWVFASIASRDIANLGAELTADEQQ